jgi:UDP-N-acetylmuramoyl-L-alanyl-D-glutamate--2,6-diaminopimelate ligase
MRLDELMRRLDDAVLLHGDPATLVSAVELDSRLAEPESIFCCVVGSSDDGHRHAAEAVRRGAVALVTEHDVELPMGFAPAEVRVAPGAARRACALLAAELAGNPAEQLTLVGVTGTNGKTTVVTILSAILEHAGIATTVIGTLTGARTTPPAPELHRVLAQAAQLAAGLGRPGAVAMEVSSHALDQDRVAGLRFAVAVFTNLSHDHLDYHRTLSDYFEAKARLFGEQSAEVAVIWSEDAEGRILLERRVGPVVAVGWDAAEALEVGPHGSRYRWRGAEIELPLLGRFNVTNALLASEAAVVLGVDPSVVAEALSSLEAVPGRMERVPGGAGDPLVLVDYAHTPDALEAALRTARGLARGGKLVVVFGCGGDRDQDKRPLMGRVASELADVAVVTTDNPRHEVPRDIADAILAGASGPARVLAISSRDLAIRAAIEEAGPGDVVLIAGKGHEATQVFADSSEPFDDRAVAASLLGFGRGEG